MPKQKIDVNEDLKVSIGDLYQVEVSDTETSESPLPAPRSPDIKNMIPKLGKISICHQRAGRGGKTVTLISMSLHKSKQNLEALLRELKKSLGCGGQIEDGTIVLQGEIADRVSEWFSKIRAK